MRGHDHEKHLVCGSYIRLCLGEWHSTRQLRAAQVDFSASQHAADAQRIGSCELAAQVTARNADIGQAKAAFFPQLTLTGFFGYQTVALSDLFSAPARTWQFGPAVTFPLFTGGRLKGNLRQAEARFQETVAQYQKSVQGAFREVSDGLIAYQRTQEFRARQEDNTQAHRDATGTANVRYEGGVTSYLEVLYNEQELFNAELALAQARRNELLSVVQLFRALGGGWQMPEHELQASFQRH